MQQKKKIVVIAPSYFRLIDENIEAIVAKLEDYGYVVEVDRNRFKAYTRPNIETKGERLNHLVSTMKRDDVDIIWPLSGGYALSHLMEGIKPKLPVLQKAKPKLLIGFSDITLLGMLFIQCLGWKWLHGPVFWQFEREEDALMELIPQILQDLPIQKKFEVTGLNKFASDMSGELIGGNLTLLQNSIGTYWEYDYQDKILFVEDVDERPYRVDRMLYHLDSAGNIKDLKGIIFAELCAPNYAQKCDMDAYVQAFAEYVGSKYQLPAFSMGGVGHYSRNQPVIVGQKYQLNVNYE